MARQLNLIVLASSKRRCNLAITNDGHPLALKSIASVMYYTWLERMLMVGNGDIEDEGRGADRRRLIHVVEWHQYLLFPNNNGINRCVLMRRIDTDVIRQMFGLWRAVVRHGGDGSMKVRDFTAVGDDVITEFSELI
jgi:hypothetical protein